MEADQIVQWVLAALEDLKAQEVTVLDVRGKTSITDYMVVASGTSDRHVRALANNVVEKLAGHQVKPLGIEGERSRDWVLVDLGDVVVHVMLPETRRFYQLEKLWQVDVEPRRAPAQS
ncbi:MAG: ribosome silencing factor [Methylohalobius sp.]|nr:ribosome silencing factor [Methylohalobius sp.]